MIKEIRNIYLRWGWEIKYKDFLKSGTLENTYIDYLQKVVEELEFVAILTEGIAKGNANASKED